MITGCRVWKIERIPDSTFSPSAPNSGPRWSMVGRLMARRMRSGTGLGPGICRKWRPLGWLSRAIMESLSFDFFRVLQLHRRTADAREFSADEVALGRLQDADPGAGGDHRAGRHAATVAGGVAQPRGQQVRGVAERVGAAALDRRLRADADRARLGSPVAGDERDPVAEHQRTVRLQVGQLEKRRRIEGLPPTR